jgi:hypothetical protein
LWVLAQEAGGSCVFGYQDVELLFQRRFVGWDGQMIFAEAFDIAADGVFGHDARFFEGVALGDKAREGGTGDRESAFVGGFE